MKRRLRQQRESVGLSLSDGRRLLRRLGRGLDGRLLERRLAHRREPP
jgi:hypothetical protein